MGAACLCGVADTMSLLLADRAFPEPADAADRCQVSPVAKGQQPHRIEQDQERPRLVEDRRGDRPEDPERGRSHRHRIEAQREPQDVLADDRDRRPGELHEVGQDADCFDIDAFDPLAVAERALQAAGSDVPGAAVADDAARRRTLVEAQYDAVFGLKR